MTKGRIFANGPESKTMAYVDFDLKNVVKAFGLAEDDEDRISFRTSNRSNRVNSSQDLLNEFAPVALGINTEQARREYIISPILIEAKRRSRVEINVFPGAMLKVDEPRGLTGYCDYLIARSSKIYYLESPIAAVVEAKREDLITGLGQCAAEMIAIQTIQREGREAPAGGVWVA